VAATQADTRPPRRTSAPTAPQLSWHFPSDGQEVALRLAIRGPNASRRVEITLDGTRVALAPKPGALRPREEVVVGGVDVPTLVVLEWRTDWEKFLRVDVFRDGVSLADRVSLAESRRTAPLPRGSYDSRMWSIQRNLLSGWFLMFLPIFAVSAASAMGNGGELSAAVVVVGTAAVVAWIAGWVGAVTLVNSFNLARPTLGGIRWLALLATIFAYPLLWWAALIAFYHPNAG
jgi:hypothetical protein